MHLRDLIPSSDPSLTLASPWGWSRLTYPAYPGSALGWCCPGQERAYDTGRHNGHRGSVRQYNALALHALMGPCSFEASPARGALFIRLALSCGSATRLLARPSIDAAPENSGQDLPPPRCPQTRRRHNQRRALFPGTSGAFGWQAVRGSESVIPEELAAAKRRGVRGVLRTSGSLLPVTSGLCKVQLIDAPQQELIHLQLN
ncbi:hypothetical protein SKAU_G00351790 [Synaphobranchus kaupii]|uniref:Uncharacterized protein n=1 Tax=Synaphobranchus kaupii TaxID=118154 RepID=A0A9Q1II88_SYNKA|nr:hypothetical protein SKAU_G00351790 [Synaphobranchus kaupii]